MWEITKNVRWSTWFMVQSMDIRNGKPVVIYSSILYNIFCGIPERFCLIYGYRHGLKPSIWLVQYYYYYYLMVVLDSYKTLKNCFSHILNYWVKSGRVNSLGHHSLFPMTSIGLYLRTNTKNLMERSASGHELRWCSHMN